ncbi:hypothetical protein K438DRAFT_913264 [Mycena galopus ATCC 62051]|nr:hypothetical protein K438DRAFT_913264 [Mycena galopus ATCC 62051]
MWGSRIPPPPGRQISAPISDPSPPFLQPTYLPLSSRYPRERRLSQPAPMAPRNDSGHVSPSSEEAGAPPWASRPVSMNEAPPSSPNTSLSPPLPRNRVPLAATPSYREPRGYRSRGGLSSGSDSEKETDSRFSTAPRQIRRPPPYAQLPGWSTQPPPLQRRRNDRDPYSESDSDSTAIVSGPLRQTTRTSSHTSAWPPQSSQITPAPSTFPRPAQSPPTYPPPSSRPAPPRNASRQYPSATHSASRSALRPRSRVTQPGDSSDSDSSIATIATETDISPWLLHSRDPSLFVAGHPVEEHKPHTSETNATSWTLREGASGVSANSGTYLPMQRQALGFNVSAGASTSYGNGAAGNNVKDVSDFGGAGANTSNLEGAAGNRRKTETFVVYSPHDDKLETPVASFTTDDFACIQPHIGIAGCLVSIHEPAEATVWIENNWDNPLVASVQKNGCGGPFPWMLSPEKPALAIFGSYQDSIVVGMAQSLADVSGLPVAIRALEDNPALTLLISTRLTCLSTQMPFVTKTKQDVMPVTMD